MRAVILVVEEDRSIRKMISEVLASSGYRVLGANAFERARRVMNLVAFDALIVTVKPTWLGEPSYAAQAKAVQPQIKVIIVSSVAFPGHHVPLVDAYVLKPFMLESLGEALIKVLRQLH